MGRVVFLTDRPSAEALPSLQALGLDVKVEPLAPDSLVHLPDLSPSAIIVDAEENAEQGYRLLATLAQATRDVPMIALTARTDLERFPWQDVADELLFSGVPAAELRIRLGMLARRTGGLGEATLRLGPLSINTETYQVLVAGRVRRLRAKLGPEHESLIGTIRGVGYRAAEPAPPDPYD